MAITTNPRDVLASLLGEDVSSQCRSNLAAAFNVRLEKDWDESRKLLSLSIAEGDIEQTLAVTEDLECLDRLDEAFNRWVKQGLQNQLKEIIGLLQ